MTRRLALLIGNSQFNDTQNFTNLRTPANDARDLANTLKTYGDFQIMDVLLEQDAQIVRQAIEELYSSAQRGDLTLLYYSGHGYKYKDGKLYLVAKDTDVNRILSTGIQESFIHEAMNYSFSKHRLTVLDCCFSGSFIKGKKSGSDRLIFEDLRGEGSIIFASSSTIQYSFELETGHNSLFTHYLLEGIKTRKADENRDGFISAIELFHYADREVRKERPRQTPMIEVSLRDTDIIISKGLEKEDELFISSLSSNPITEKNKKLSIFAKYFGFTLMTIGIITTVWAIIQVILLIRATTLIDVGFFNGFNSWMGSLGFLGIGGGVTYVGYWTVNHLGDLINE